MNPNAADVRLAKRRAAHNHGTGRGKRDHLTVDEKREIVRAVVGRFENPLDVAKRIGCTRETVLHTVAAYRLRRFSMIDEVAS
jgi:hypothetical protein